MKIGFQLYLCNASDFKYWEVWKLPNVYSSEPWTMLNEAQINVLLPELLMKQLPFPDVLCFIKSVSLRHCCLFILLYYCVAGELCSSLYTGIHCVTGAKRPKQITMMAGSWCSCTFTYWTLCLADSTSCVVAFLTTAVKKKGSEMKGREGGNESQRGLLNA